MEKQVPLAAPPPSLPRGYTNDNFLQEHLMAILVIITSVIALWELYLSFRQRNYMQKHVQRPQILDNLLSAEVYEKSRIYALDKNTFGIVQDVYSTIMNILFMIYWGFYFGWKWGQDLVELCGLDPNNEYYVTSGCLTVMKIYSAITCDLPFSIYSTFVLEAKHNFNKQTPLFYIKDQILKFVVSQVLTVPLMCAIVYIVKHGGDFFFLYLWMFVVIISLVLMVVYPEIIAPIFDKYTPLPEGELRVQIEALAASVGFPLYKLFVVEGSRRSSHSNAYLYGFYKYKRIVLFDTLVAEYQRKKAEEEAKKKAEQNGSSENVGNENKKDEKKEIIGCETDEIIAVLAHELGHWHHNHAIQAFGFGQVTILTNFILFAQLLHYSPIYEVFGFTDSKPVLIGLIVVTSYVLAPVNKLLSWTMTLLTRRNEFQADGYARKLGHADALKRALVKLHKDNLGYPLFDKLYSNWHRSHPPLLERIDALKKDE